MDFNTTVQDLNVKEDQDVYVNQNQHVVHQSFIRDTQIELWAKEQIHAVQKECAVQVLAIHVQDRAIHVVIHATEFHAVIHVLILVSYFYRLLYGIGFNLFLL